MQLSGGLDLGYGIEIGHHRELFAPPEQRAAPAVGHDLFWQPGVRNNRKAHVRKVRGLMGEDTQVVVTARSRADLQFVDQETAESLPAPFLADNERADFRKRCAERRELAAGHDRSATVDSDDEAVDSRCELTQLAGKEMARLLVALNQLVDLPRVAADSRPKLRRAPGDRSALRMYWARPADLA